MNEMNLEKEVKELKKQIAILETANKSLWARLVQISHPENAGNLVMQPSKSS